MWTLASGCPLPAQDSAASAAEVEEITVYGQVGEWLSDNRSASEGSIDAKEIRQRPLLRVGEMLEAIPGFITTQHSGTGKSNQYFLRGFNLDHGTDFSASLEGVPLNQPSHGHGQGYLDLNFIIPELIERLDFKKGPYYASVGDFSSAGTAQMHLVDSLPTGFLKIGFGEDDFGRILLADSIPTGDGHLIFGVEAQTYDGEWSSPENARKYNGILRLTQGNLEQGYSITGSFYDGRWNSTDQIPSRGLQRGTLGLRDTIDPSDGGESGRYGLSANWWQGGTDTYTEVLAYASYYHLNLFSNFTYFLNDPVNGDQFEQEDQRFTTGAHLNHTWWNDWLGEATEQTFGLQLRNDYIPEIGLYDTLKRRRLRTVRSDRIIQTSAALYYENTVDWSETFQTTQGLRADFYHFQVNARNAVNSGTATDAILSPKLGAAWQAAEHTEIYGKVGFGFHSNDARGTTLRRDPQTGMRARPVDPLVSTQGAELGVRNQSIDGLQTALAIWWLQADSELLFVGDAGTTEATGPTRRYGVEWTSDWAVTDWLSLDLDLALSNAAFTGVGPRKNEIPGSLSTVLGAGLQVDLEAGYFGSLRARHFGKRPLTENGGIRSDPSTLFHLQLGHKRGSVGVYFDVLNLLDSKDHDIDYAYTSRLPGEPAAGVEDVHFHPFEGRTIRGYLVIDF